MLAFLAAQEAEERSQGYQAQTKGTKQICLVINSYSHIVISSFFLNNL